MRKQKTTEGCGRGPPSLEENPMEQRKFLAMVGPLAQADMQKSGILASLTVAQAILESGWGTSELATKANALFGIKADARWSGRAYSKDTKECYDGVTYATITALFRAYDSWAESVAGHSAFLLANKRYAAVVGERDYKAACKAIKAAGYATDPGYPQKLIGLIEKYGLTVYDGKAEQEDKTSMNISITKKTSTHNTTAAYRWDKRAVSLILERRAGNTSSQPASKPSQSNTGNAGNTASQPAKPVHTHTWITQPATGHYITKTIKEAYDEPIYVTGYIFPDGYTCLTPDEAVDHSVDSGLGYRTGQVQNGTKHHNAETQQVWVQDSAAYQYCSGCGARR